MPFASAASIAPHRIFVPTTVATCDPPLLRANRIAATPGGSSAPDSMAASVSSKWNLALSMTSSGSARVAAADM